MADEIAPAASSDIAIEQETLELAKRLIACRSVTPADGGSLDVIVARLELAGFECERIDRNGVSNVWARQGRTSPVVCLAGHVDVVPPGPVVEWRSDPFTPDVRDGFVYGRGAADMKGPLAALLTAAERVVSRRRLTRSEPRGSIAILVTSDEEGVAIDGTAAVVHALRARGELIDACILGEPTSVEQLGDVMKNGRRGSLNGKLTVRGVQCHIAYPERGRNPIHDALPALAELAAAQWDNGTDYFPPTRFQVSNVRAGEGVVNVIPGTLEVLFNFRFSTASPQERLIT
jgi:succinyl-diaminopimelate desuccinylase